MSENGLYIVYASEGGNAKSLAEDFAKRCNSLAMEGRLVSLNQFAEQSFAKSKAVLFVSTTGNGELPRNGNQFVAKVSMDNAAALSELSYALFALGNPAYTHFCGAGKTVHQCLVEAKSRSLSSPVFAGEGYEELYAAWAMATLADLSGLSEADLVDRMEAFSAKSTADYRLEKRVLLTSEAAEKETCHLVLSATDEALNYSPGDVVSVRFDNAPERVDAVLNLMGFSGGEEVARVGKHFTAREYLTEQVEISRINADLVKKTGAILNDWTLLGDASNEDKLADMVAQYDLQAWMESYPVAADKWLEFLTALPEKTARYYSIASDPEEMNGQLHLTVALQKQQFEQRTEYGLGSGMLCRSLPAGETLSVALETHPNFHLQTKAPMVWVAVGTGIAPFIGFLQHLLSRFPDDRPKVMLYYGVRHPEQDFLYQAFLEYCEQQGVVELNMCFSRLEEKKHYVQHALEQNIEQVGNCLGQQGHVYVCGSDVMWQSVEPVLQHALLTQYQELEEARTAWQEFAQMRLHCDIY